ncbi:MAG TPA: hypothetical protein VFS21_36475 [Roseiflexaceae bacterium]|nr:hypothetical protein [Roseiflexaceae bacterium]
MTLPDLSETRAIEAQVLAVRESYWHAWKRYVAEQRRALEQLQHPSDDDLTIAWESAPAAAALPQALRRELGEILEERRQDALLASANADPDEVLATLLTRIEDELDGKMHPEGLALVRIGDQLVTLNRPALEQQTTPEDLAAALPPARRRGRNIWLILGGSVLAAVLVGLVGWQLTAAPRRVAVPAPVVRVGQQEIVVWTVQAMAVADIAVEYPRAILDGAGMTVCVTKEQQAVLRPGETVTISSTQSLRTYQVVTLTPEAAADLVLAECGQQVRPLAGGTLQLATTALSLDPAMVVSVRTWESAIMPAAIPAGQMEVALTLAPETPADGVLVLPDGSTRAPAKAPAATEAGTIVRFLVPAASTTQRMAWRVDGNGLPRRLALDVPAPLGRAELLRAALRVADAEVTPGADGALSLTLSLQLTADAPPLQLDTTDFSVLDARGAAIAASWAPPALTPGVATPVVVSLPPGQATGPLELALGSWRARLAGRSSAGSSPIK